MGSNKPTFRAIGIALKDAIKRSINRESCLIEFVSNPSTKLGGGRHLFASKRDDKERGEYFRKHAAQPKVDRKKQPVERIWNRYPVRDSPGYKERQGAKGSKRSSLKFEIFLECFSPLRPREDQPG